MKGNVRQLYNALMQAAVLTDGKTIGRKEIAASVAEMPDASGPTRGLVDRPLGDGFDLEDHLNDIHRQYYSGQWKKRKASKRKPHGCWDEELSNPRRAAKATRYKRAMGQDS